MNKVAVIGLFFASIVFAVTPKPMESLSRYNVVLIHGAAPSSDGFESDCKYKEIKDAWNTFDDYFRDPINNSGKLGGSPGMLGLYDQTGNDKLTYWLDSMIFEDTSLYSSDYIYIQRSFANPAETPAHNAHEIGDRTWKGNKNCFVRRSLFEEAQEVRAQGQEALNNKRISRNASYRAIPSRNILIAHSMGGVASHEYVTDLNIYNNDVDKVITLDSPHEGTGSLNLLIDMRAYGRQFTEASTQFLLLWGVGLSYCAIVKDPHSAVLSLWLMVPNFGLSAVERIVTTIVDKWKLEDAFGFKSGDPLTSYIAPGSKGISDLIERPAHENMPMFRLLAGKGGMTFSDPNEGINNVMNFLIPEGITNTVFNIAAQLDGDGSSAAIYTNVVTSMILGIFGGIALQDVGTTLIPENSGLASSTKAFNSLDANVRRFTFDAAPNANAVESGRILARNIAEITGVVSGIMAADIGLAAFPWAQVAAKIAIGVVGAALLAQDVGYVTAKGVDDLSNSHENAKTRRMLDTLYSADFSYTKVKGGNESGRIRLMEDFLYERPFVNLGLFISDSALRSVEPGCYYEAEDADGLQLCEVGLFGGDGKVAASNGKRNYSEFRKGDIKFRSASDWSKVGVKVDRWEKVDGLTPSGELAKNSVPIRHVERYEAPAIAVEDWIEKYSFVVDDLMPHRLRQIRMSFNYREEIAWEFCYINDCCFV